MKNFYLRLFIFCLLCIVGNKSYAFYDKQNVEIDGIYYNLNSSDKTAEVASHSYSGSITIPSTISYNGNNYSVTVIGNLAFEGCEDLNNIELPNTITTIGDWAFRKCSGLKSIIIPNSVTIIGKKAFDSCTGLTNVIIPNNVATIGYSAFYRCTGLSEIIIGNHVTTIDAYAFEYCTNVTEIIIPNSVTTLGYNVFGGCEKLKEIVIPKNVTEIKGALFQVCNALEKIIVEDDNPNYDSRDNCNAIIEKSTKTLLSGCKNTIIPQNVDIIGDFAFSGFKDISNITIPLGVITIGKGAFWGCGLTDLDIPISVTSVGERAFQQCFALKSISIPLSVKNIGSYAFYDCTELTNITSNILNPFAVDESAFQLLGDSDNPITASLNVPIETKEKYQTTAGWNKFQNIVEVELPDGSVDRPFNAIEAKAMTIGLAANETSSDSYYIKGIISKINDPFSSRYGNATFWISNDGSEKNQFYIYRTNYIENRKWQEGDVQIKVGDEVVVYGNLLNYRGKYAETGQCYLYSINGDKNPTSILDIETCKHIDKVFYSSNGQQRNTPLHGLTIIRMSNGTTKKVIMK